MGRFQLVRVVQPLTDPRSGALGQFLIDYFDGELTDVIVEKAKPMPSADRIELIRVGARGTQYKAFIFIDYGIEEVRFMAYGGNTSYSRRVADIETLLIKISRKLKV